MIVIGAQVDHLLECVLPPVHAGRNLVGDVLPIHGVSIWRRRGAPRLPAWRVSVWPGRCLSPKIPCRSVCAWPLGRYVSAWPPGRSVRLGPLPAFAPFPTPDCAERPVTNRRNCSRHMKDIQMVLLNLGKSGLIVTS